MFLTNVYLSKPRLGECNVKGDGVQPGLWDGNPLPVGLQTLANRPRGA